MELITVTQNSMLWQNESMMFNSLNHSCQFKANRRQQAAFVYLCCCSRTNVRTKRSDYIIQRVAWSVIDRSAVQVSQLIHNRQILLQQQHSYGNITFNLQLCRILLQLLSQIVNFTPRAGHVTQSLFTRCYSSVASRPCHGSFSQRNQWNKLKPEGRCRKIAGEAFLRPSIQLLSETFRISHVLDL